MSNLASTFTLKDTSSAPILIYEEPRSPPLPIYNTSKLVSVPQPQVQQGPTTRRTVWRSASRMENLGRKGCQVWSTWPMVVPGGACTSIWKGRQGCCQAGRPWLELLIGNCSDRLSKTTTLSEQFPTLPTNHHKTCPAHLLKATGTAAAPTVKWAEEAEHLAVPRVR